MLMFVPGFLPGDFEGELLKSESKYFLSFSG